MYRLALDGYEKSLGKAHEWTKGCAGNLAQLLELQGRKKECLQVVDNYPGLKVYDWMGTGGGDWDDDDGDDDDDDLLAGEWDEGNE